MNTKNILFVLGLTIFAFAPIKAMNKAITKEWQHTFKLSYNNKPLSWDQTEALLASKYLKDMIFDEIGEYDGKEIALDAIINNNNEPEQFKNNILDIINIVPSIILHGANLKKESENIKLLRSSEEKANASIKIHDHAKKTTHDKIASIVNNQKDKVMGMIYCAHYINSLVRDDLIDFALNHNLIDQKILESPDYTLESLKTIKKDYTENAEILNTILPMETIDTLIDQQTIDLEENIVNNAIKTAYYKMQSDEEKKWLCYSIFDVLDLESRELIKTENRFNKNPKYTLFNFSNISLSCKVEFLKTLQSTITNITNDINNRTTTIENDIKQKKAECLKTFLTSIPVPFIELALTLLIKKYLVTKPHPLTAGQSYFFQKVFTMAIPMMIQLHREKSPPTGWMFSPLYQIAALYELIKSYRANAENYDDQYIMHIIPIYSVDDFAKIEADQRNYLMKKKKKLEHIQTTLRNIIKNEYAVKIKKN